MSVTPRIDGVLPPLPTPFHKDGALDLGALRDLVARLNEAPLAGYLALGSNGEAPHVSPEEASEVFTAVRAAAAPGRTVLGGTGQLSTRATVEMTQRAADAGCDAVLVLAPYYFKGSMTPEVLRRHLATVAGRSPVPVLLYNVPGNTGLHLPIEVVVELSRHPNVIGIKDSAGDIGQLAEIVRTTRGESQFHVLSGSFAATLPGLSVGVVGAILAVANLLPTECAALLTLFREGRIAEARALHLRLLPVARAVTKRFGVPGLKAALDLRGVPCGVPRSPLLPATAEVRRELEKVMVEAGV